MKVSQGIRRTLLLLALLLSVSPVATATTVEFETGSYKAIVGVGVDGDAGTLQVTRNMEDGGTQTRMLPPSLRHVDDVRAAHAKLLIVGRTNQLNDLLVIYGLPSLGLLDVILCRDLVLSPSARYVVFERFFPRSAPERHAQHLTLLYDVSATPQQNRLGGAPVPSFQSGSRSIDAGYPIYPQTSSDESNPYLIPVTAAREEKDRDHTRRTRGRMTRGVSRSSFTVERTRHGRRSLSLLGLGMTGDRCRGRPSTWLMTFAFRSSNWRSWMDRSVWLERAIEAG